MPPVRSLLLSLVLASAAGLTSPVAGWAEPSALAVPVPASPAAELRSRLDDPAGAKVAGHALDVALIRQFYAARDFQPAWSGAAAATADHLLADLRAAAEAQGLVAEAYAVPAATSAIERDLLISEALARFGRDLATGRLPPNPSYGGIGADTRPSFDATPFLARAASGATLAQLLAGVEPADPAYHRLVAALAGYRAIVAAGGWPQIPDGPTIRPGDTDPRVPAVRRRLVASGDLDGAAAKAETGTALDHHTVAALKHFQLRHGMDPDGSVGKQTRIELNVSAAERLRQIEANLERWRSLPRQFEARRIAVNLPAQTLELLEDDQPALAMRVVVGDVKHPTPPMATAMTAVIVNPTWTIPPSIASKEILPKLKRDPNYLATNHIRILDAPEDEASGQATDWSAYRKKMPFRLRQVAGPDNALGQLKFYLKDLDAIYLHDTPQRTFFKRSMRALSHGCVRVERPVELAERLLGGDWSEKLPKAIADKITKTLPLGQPVPVYLMYWTAWADTDGTVHFRDDLYGHDARLMGAIEHPTPAPTGQMAQDPPHTPL